MRARENMDATDTDTEQPTMDPVCGREMTVGMELLDFEYGGKAYPFCSEHCRWDARARRSTRRPTTTVRHVRAG
jgi:YHS domain-containing protein